MPFSFSRGPGIARSPCGPISLFPRFSPLRYSPGFEVWLPHDSRTIPNRQRTTLRCRAYVLGTGILTCFPFPCLQLGTQLGPTNPQSTIVAEETLPFRRRRFSRRFVVTFSRILIPTGSSCPYEQHSAPAGHLSTRLLAYGWVSETGLVPSILGAGNLGG